MVLWYGALSGVASGFGFRAQSARVLRLRCGRTCPDLENCQIPLKIRTTVEAKKLGLL